jgi:WD40 repeat protein
MLTDTPAAPDAARYRSSTGPAAGPYVGLRPYEASERKLFFGRDRDALFLCNKVLSARLTIFYSQSGLGKSSLLRTIVIPQLERDGPVIYFDAWSQDLPLAALKEKLAQHASDLGVPSADAGAPTLTQLVRLIRTEDTRPLTLVLDQFEEFLTTHGNRLDPVRAELAELTRTTQVDVQIMLSLREEFLAALEPFREQIVSLFQSTYRLEGLDDASLRDAIRLPPREFNGSCDDELVEILLRDLKARNQVQQDSSAIAVELPTLQLVCSQLWDEAQRAGQSKLTVALYEKAGGVKKILDRYIKASMPGKWQDQVLAARLMRLLAPTSGVKVAYSAGDLAENVGADKVRVESLLHDLESARILQTRHSKHGRRYELQHDAFIAVIAPWRDQVLARRLRMRQTLVTLSVVAAILLIVATVSVVDRRYRRANARESALRDLVQQVNSELGAKPAFKLLLATTAYAVGLGERGELQGSTESALRLALSRVGSVPFADPGGSVLKAALNRDGSRLVTAGSNGVLIWDVRGADDPKHAAAPRRLAEGSITHCVMSPGGRWLLTVASGTSPRIWDLSGPATKPIDIAPTGAPSAMTFSDDEQWLAVALDTRDIEIWGLGGPQPSRRQVLSPPPEFTAATLYTMRFGSSPVGPALFAAYDGLLDDRFHVVVLRSTVGPQGASSPEMWWKEEQPVDRGYISMALGENGAWLAALTLGDQIRVARLEASSPDLPTGFEGLDLAGISGDVTFATLAFGSNNVLAIADRKGTIGLWDAGTRKRSRELLGHDERVDLMSFSADGRVMVSAGRDGTARLWDLGQIGTNPWAFGTDGAAVRDLAFSGDRPWLVTAGGDGVRRFDLANRGALPTLLAKPEQSELGVLDASQDSRWLAAGRDDGAVFVWNDASEERPADAKLLTKFDEKVSAIAFSRDSQWLAVGSDDKRIMAWRLDPGRPPQFAFEHRHLAEVMELSFSDDSHWLASGSAVGDVMVWRLGAEVQQKASSLLAEQLGRVHALAFDRRGSLAIAHDDGKVRLWDSDRMQWRTDPWQVRPEGEKTAEYASNVAFSPDGRWLIAGTSNRKLLRWQPSGRSSAEDLLGSLGRSSNAAREGGGVNGMAIAADGRLAISLSGEPVAIATVEDSPRSATLWGPSGKVWKLAFSGPRTSDRFVGAVVDDKAWVWSVARGRGAARPDEIIQLACRAAGRNWSTAACADLRSRFVGLPNWDVCEVCSGAAR